MCSFNSRRSTQRQLNYLYGKRKTFPTTNEIEEISISKRMIKLIENFTI